MTLLRCLAAVLVLCIGHAAAAQSGEYFGQAQVGQDFTDIGGRFDDGQRVRVMVRIDEAEGFYVICAAVGASDNEDNEEMLRYLQMSLNGEVILRGFNWAPMYVNAMGRRAKCHRTGARVVANPVFDAGMQRSDF